MFNLRVREFLYDGMNDLIFLSMINWLMMVEIDSFFLVNNIL